MVDRGRSCRAGRGEMSPDSLAAVMIGTTQFINAFLQRRDLTQVAAVRVALPKSDGIPPMVGWPEDLVECRRPTRIPGERRLVL